MTRGATADLKITLAHLAMMDMGNESDRKGRLFIKAGRDFEITQLASGLGQGASYTI